MTPEELRASITERIAADANIRRVLSAIAAQTADLSDSQRYALRAGEISGKALAAALLDLDASGRSASVFGILWDRYEDENQIFDEIQEMLDAKIGIQLTPQHAAFPEERAQNMANALCDDTADQETLQRRAESTANIVAAMHDGNVRANAEFRDRAGLQSSAIREGGAKCCEWCASVSGKYPASDTPQGFWGRHDNCKCSILYETKRGWRTHTGTGKAWQPRPAEDAGAPEPTRLTAEQAAEREARHSTVAFTPEQAKSLQEAVLTNSSQGAIIETERGMHFRSFDSASAYMKQRFGLSVSGLDEMPLENLKAVSNCIHRMYRDIPKLEGFIDRIVLEDMPDIARATVLWHGDNPEILLKLSRAYFTTMSIPEIEEAVQAACRIKYFSEKSELYGVFKHEAAHLVEYFMTFKKYGRNAEARASLDRYELASQIIEQAFAECEIERSDQTVELYISTYACKNAAEVIAEAYSSEDSNKLVDTMKRIIQKKWRL